MVLSKFDKITKEHIKGKDVSHTLIFLNKEKSWCLKKKHNKEEFDSWLASLKTIPKTNDILQGTIWYDDLSYSRILQGTDFWEYKSYPTVPLWAITNNSEVNEKQIWQCLENYDFKKIENTYKYFFKITFNHKVDGKLSIFSYYYEDKQQFRKDHGFEIKKETVTDLWRAQ